VFVTDASTDGPPGAYSLLLLTVLLVGVLDGVSQGAIFGDAAALPSEYTHVRGVCRSGARGRSSQASLPSTAPTSLHRWHTAAGASTACVQLIAPGLLTEPG
jgi:hypothetical protein